MTNGSRTIKVKAINARHTTSIKGDVAVSGPTSSNDDNSSAASGLPQCSRRFCQYRPISNVYAHFSGPKTPTARACQLRCASVARCLHYSWFGADSMCYLSDEKSSLMEIKEETSYCGPATCKEQFQSIPGRAPMMEAAASGSVEMERRSAYNNVTSYSSTPSFSSTSSAFSTTVGEALAAAKTTAPKSLAACVTGMPKRLQPWHFFDRVVLPNLLSHSFDLIYVLSPPGDTLHYSTLPHLTMDASPLANETTKEGLLARLQSVLLRRVRSIHKSIR